MSKADRRMIEQEMPLRAVNFASGKEKKHPRRHVELIHLWPARRPRSASRVALAASLLKAPETTPEFIERLQLLEELAPYECSAAALQSARRLIRADHDDRAPRVLDMFAGGGVIPLEAANLGCDAHAVELNPVAHLVELATCVYPQQFGDRLADLVEKWGKVVLAEVTQEIGDLYPGVTLRSGRESQQLAFAGEYAVSSRDKVFQPITYLWTRTVPCVNRDCGAVVPLVKQTWLCKKDGRAIAIRMVPDRSQKRARFEIATASSESDLGFDPSAFSERGDAECPLCGAAVDGERVKDYGLRGLIGHQLMAVAGTVDGQRGRVYLGPNAVPMPDAATLAARLATFGDEWPGPAAVELPHDARNFWAYLYGADEYWKFFSDRQAIALLTFSRTIREKSECIAREVADEALARACVTALAMALDRLADYCNVICTWHTTVGKINHGFARQALPMVWDYAEVNPLVEVSGSFMLALRAQVDAIRGLRAIPTPVTCVRASATNLPYEDGYFDAVVTDPPYYDNISYADLSDFFYVWLKRTVEAQYPDHLAAAETPKREEATVVPYRHDGSEEVARGHYERLMTAAFSEAVRCLKPGGPLVVVYAHKTVAGWGALVDALRNAGCVVTEAWPFRTEADTRLNARDTAALATSVFLAARKRTDARTCYDYDEVVLPAAQGVVAERVATLWKAGITGADLIIAAIGAALAPFTVHEAVQRTNGVPVSTEEFLDEAQRMVLEAILKQVVRDATGKEVSVAGIDPISRLYVVSRIQFGEAAADFDSFKNLAIGALPPGTELDGIRGALMQGKGSLLLKKGSKVAIRGYVERGEHAALGLLVDGKAPPLIDVLHRLLWLQRNRPSEIAAFLGESRADLEAVRLLAQALGGRPLRAEPRPGAQKDERTEEQRAIDTFLASFQDLTRHSTLGPLFDRRGSATEESR